MYNVQVEWGRDGLAAQLSGSDVIVIVDVLSFSTCVDVAVGRGAAVLPFGSPGAEAEAFARTVGAECATARGQGHLSLSPATLAHLESGQKVVLPSPNGAALSRQTGQVRTLTACLRNAAAVARAAERAGPRITVVAAGERWPSGALRPALEDWIGAGGSGWSPVAGGGRSTACLRGRRFAFGLGSSGMRVGTGAYRPRV
jgi:2-phosphosulfolactate phosphatase